MKRIYQTLLASAALFGLTVTGSATIIVDQTSWPNFTGGDDTIVQKTNQNLPFTLGWQAGTAALYNGTNGTLIYGPFSASFTTWAYVGGTNIPIQTNADIVLNVGDQVRVTTTMTFSNVADASLVGATRGLRFGLLYSGIYQAPLTNAGTIRNDHLTGYGQNMNFANIFGNQPLQTIADTNKVDGEAVLSKDAQLALVGENGGGYTNDPGFLSDVSYKLIFNVAEAATNAIDITTTWIGPNLTNGFITQTVTDTNWLYTNFDTWVFRPNSSSRFASGYTLTSFKVEQLPITPPAPQFTAAKRQGTSAILTWNCTPGYSYTVLRTNDLRAPLATWPTVVTGYPVGYTTGSSISFTDTTATVSPNFYLIKSP